MKKPILFILLATAIAYSPQIFSETTYFTSFIANFLFTHNLHEVVPGKFYRSAQMSPADITRVIADRKIKTVIDLRLEQDGPDETGVTEEQAVTASGAKYFNIPIASSNADQQVKIRELLEIYNHEEVPILVHCSSGTHRSGVSAALWLLEKEHSTPEKALEQLSLKYGFIQLERDFKSYMQGHPTLDALVHRYIAERNGSSLSFRNWLDAQPPTKQYEK